MSIFIKTITEDIVIIPWHETDSIEKIKAKIQVTEGTPSAKQKLIFEGRELKDGRSLSDYNISIGAIVYAFGPTIKRKSQKT